MITLGIILMIVGGVVLDGSGQNSCIGMIIAAAINFNGIGIL